MWFISYTVHGAILQLFASFYSVTFLILIKNTQVVFFLNTNMSADDLHLVVACTCKRAQIILFYYFGQIDRRALFNMVTIGPQLPQ